MPQASSLRFAAAARLLAAECRRRGLAVPAFRSPPRLAADRSLRRRPDGLAVVAVRIRHRPVAEVVADMVDGVLAANGTCGSESAPLREALRRAVEVSGEVDSGEVDSGEVDSGEVAGDSAAA